MDLLVYVVQRNELHPSQISLSEITDQFLSYLDGLDEADLSEAGEFLQMASRLMTLKARELLPREEQSEEELFEFDEQRSELIRSIVEYRAFRRMADGLRGLEEESRERFGRGRREPFGRIDGGVQGGEAGIFQLYEAFSLAMKASRSLYNDAVHTIEIDFYTIQDAQQQVGNILRRRGRAAFDELVGPDRQPLVTATTFQALLEMVKTEQAVVRQVDPQAVLWTYRKRDNEEYLEELSNSEQEHPTEEQELEAGLVDFIRDRSLVRGNEMGLDDLVRELTARVQEGRRVRDRDLDHLLQGGALADLDQQLVEETTTEESQTNEEAQPNEEAEETAEGREEETKESEPEGEEESPFNFDSLFR